MAECCTKQLSGWERPFCCPLSVWPDLDVVVDEVAGGEILADTHKHLTQPSAVGLPSTFSPTGKPLVYLCHTVTQ